VCWTPSAGRCRRPPRPITLTPAKNPTRLEAGPHHNQTALSPSIPKLSDSTDSATHAEPIQLIEYCGRVVPLFAEAFGVGEPKPDELKHIAAEALGIWRTHGELNTRYGVQAAIAAFDHWRDRQ
jgi:hypothetical protein